MIKPRATEPRQEANQTVRLAVEASGGRQSIRICFTNQRLSAHGGMIVWSHFLQQKRFRCELEKVLPQRPTSPNAYVPGDIALGFLGGILCGADKLSRVAWLQSDAALPEVLGIEAIPSQSTLSRFFAGFDAAASAALGGLHAWAARALPSRREDHTLDVDSWALLHEDGHQEGVAVGYTRRGLKPCLRPLLAALAESKLVVGYRLRQGNTACVSGAAEFLRETLAALPAQVRIGLVRMDSGFATKEVFTALEEARLSYIIAAQLSAPVQRLCRHDDAQWRATELPGLEVQEVGSERPGRRLIVIRQRVAERPQSGGKTLLEVPGYRFQALHTNLPASFDALAVWRRYCGRAEIENRIKELGAQFGIKALCCARFAATEACHQLAIIAYNLCVLLQRRLGQLEKIQLQTLRWRLFARAAVWSRARGKPTLKLAVRGAEHRHWWHEILLKLTAPPNCHAVESLAA